MRQGRPVIRDLHITAWKRTDETADMPPDGLTTTTLRKLHMTNDYMADEIAVIFEKGGIPVVSRLEGKRRRARTAKNAYTDDQVAEFAENYLLAVRKAPRRPRAWLREEYVRRGDHVPKDYVKDMLKRAADRGFLSESAGGGSRQPREATKKLTEWIETHRSSKRKKGAKR